MSIFINYDGIKGESSDAGHKDWMDVTDLKFGTGRSITSATSTQGDRESSNAQITDLIIARHTDSATPKLFIESCCGTGKDVTIHFTKTGSGGGADVYMEINLKNALISSYNIAAASQSSKRPQELITLSFVDIEIKYTQYDEDGLATAPVAVGFNTATNTKK